MLEVTASTDDFIFEGNHEVKIQGTSLFTTTPQTVETPAFKIIVEGCSP